MSTIKNFFDEVGFSESVCTRLHWNRDILELYFSEGISLGGSTHPLADIFIFNSPCRIIFEGVIKSQLRVSHLVQQPNQFEDIHFEKNDLPSRDTGKQYSEFEIEGTMLATSPTGWFNWYIYAENFYFDDLK